jgi:hypothetical protein
VSVIYSMTESVNYQIMETALLPLPESVQPTTGSVMAKCASAVLMLEAHAIIMASATAGFVKRDVQAAARLVHNVIKTMIVFLVRVPLAR